MDFDPAFGGIPVEGGDSDPAFGGQLVQEQPQQQLAQAVAPEQPKTMGERIQAAMRTLPGVLPAQALYGEASRAVTGEGRKEDYPEISLDWTSMINPQEAKTDKGMLNLLKRNVPDEYKDYLSLDYDKYGNPLVSIEEDVGPLKAGKFYFNKPGVSYQDVNAVGPMLDEAGLPIAASAVGGPLGWARASALTGTSGSIAELIDQGEANMLGAEEDVNIGDVIKAGLLSAGGEAGGRLIARVADATIEVGRRILGSKSASIIDDAGNFTDDFIKAADERGISLDDLSDMVKRHMKTYGDDITPEQAANRAIFESLDMKPTRAMVTRRGADFRREETLARSGQGDDLIERQMEIDRQLFGKVRGMGPAGATDDPFIAAESAKMAVTEKKAAVDKLVSKQYDKVREIHGERPLQVEGLVRTIDELEDYVGLVPQIDVIKKRLIRYGVLDKSGKISGGLTAKQSEILRREINELNPGYGDASRLMGRLKESLDDDVLKNLGEDVFGGARAAASAGFREFKDRKIVKELIGDKFDDVDFVQKAIISPSVKSTQLQELKQTLLYGNKGNEKLMAKGSQAFQDIRGATIKWLSEQAKSGRLLNEAGEPMFSGPNFAKALEKIGKRKLKVLFSDDEIDLLMTIKKAGQLKSPVPGSVNTSGTAASWWDNLFARASNIPGGQSLVGLLRSASSGVREMKTRAAVSEALTPTFEKAAEKMTGKYITPVTVGMGAASGE